MTIYSRLAAKIQLQVSTVCLLSPSRKQIATEGGNLREFQNALLVCAFTNKEANIKLGEFVGKHCICTTGKCQVVQERAEFKNFPRYPA